MRGYFIQDRPISILDCIIEIVELNVSRRDLRKWWLYYKYIQSIHKIEGCNEETVLLRLQNIA